MDKDKKEVLNCKIADTSNHTQLQVLSLGYLRYEALRKLNPAQFAELNRKNVWGNDGASKVTFDELVDELVVKGIS